MASLRIGYFYKDLLNLYGDNGNIEILVSRARARGFDVEVTDVSLFTSLTSEDMRAFDLVFMGGGPDSGQKQMYEDLFKNKGSYLTDYIEEGGTGLFICGSYQLLGKYYKVSDGTVLPGIGVFDLYTENFGPGRPRCIGNVVCDVSGGLGNDPVFQNVNHVGNTLVGFENHGGRTYISPSMTPLAKVLIGHGNNSEDRTEGVIYKNSIGSYLHGPVLSKNPHLADFLLAKALGMSSLEPLDDTLIISAHTAAKNLKQ